MDGILCIDKPVDYTSFDVVARLRGMSKTKKVGHSGTLDPMATGVLPLFFGAATRAADRLPSGDKRYTAGFRLGRTTDTLDSTGTLLSETESHVSREELLALLPRFTGEIEQIPPMYSAVRVNGKRLHEIARAGGEVERKARPVTVYALSLLEFDPAAQAGRLDVSCSKGTYIRTLIDDIGRALGPGGIMTALVRTEACGFTLADCMTLEEAQELAGEGALEQRLLPVDRVFGEYPAVRLNEAQSRMFQNGVRLDLARLPWTKAEGLCRVYGNTGDFLGLAFCDRVASELRIEKMFR